jgi:hypothetical protein
MKQSLYLAAALAAAMHAAAALAAPTLYADPYPQGPGQPSAASVTVNGTSSLPCTLTPANDGSVTPTCDLASLPVGTHTLVLVVSNAYGCQPAADGSGATCYAGGSASSDPFTYSLSTGPVTKPLRKFKP